MEVEVGVLLAHADLVLPVGQPAVPALSPCGTPGGKSLLSAHIPSGCQAPASPTSEMGPSGARAVRPGVIGDLDAVPDQDTPKGPRVAVILGAAPTPGGPTLGRYWVQWAPHWQGCGRSGWTLSPGTASQLPHQQLMVGTIFRMMSPDGSGRGPEMKGDGQQLLPPTQGAWEP